MQPSLHIQHCGVILGPELLLNINALHIPTFLFKCLSLFFPSQYLNGLYATHDNYVLELCPLEYSNDMHVL